MKRYLKWLIISNLFLAFMVLLPVPGYSQLGDPTEDPDAPIDGGVSILIAAGVGYGLKKARDSRKDIQKPKDKEATV